MHKVASVLVLLILSVCHGKQQDFTYEDYDYEGLPGTGEQPASNGENIDEEKIAKEVDFPVFKSRSGDISANEGETVEFSCKTTKPTQHVLILKKNDTLIYVGNMAVSKAHHIENFDGVFKFTNISRADTGTYVCHYQSTPVSEIQYKLDVQYPATFIPIRHPKLQRVKKGQSVSMRCPAQGNPKPVITWSKEKGRLPSGAEKEEGYSITLEDVDRHVEGTYICTADNGIGDPVSQSWTVHVDYPPEISTEKAIVRTGEGDKVELVCIVHSRPPAEVTWSKDGYSLGNDKAIQETDGGHRHSITISPVSEEHFGSYQCGAQNEQGGSNATINLTDLPKQPHFTSPATSAIETSYTLVWETESYYPITEYNIKYRRAKANESTGEPGEWTQIPAEVKEGDVEIEGLVHRMKHTLKDLLPATDYQATVSVKNKYKWGAEGNFNFSTRKADPKPHETSTTTSLPLVFAEEKVQHPSEETVSWQKTSGSGYALFSVGLCVASLIISLIS